eukprot:TRINITY_DN16504_c0_g2_i1.p2 TRINITY_DN16504_c0_g2~~TRINITY_DN16504_c0_g2_i1.p2  ORF type:complete len:118 (+),score=13.42 TRINITY_DN16504_c0_g2_i1:44-355(+)
MSDKSFLYRLTGCLDRVRRAGQKKHRFPQSGRTLLDIIPMLGRPNTQINQLSQQDNKKSFLDDKTRQQEKRNLFQKGNQEEIEKQPKNSSFYILLPSEGVALS